MKILYNKLNKKNNCKDKIYKYNNNLVKINFVLSVKMGN